VQHRLELVEHRALAADPERELARLRALGPAAHRRVEQVEALLGEGGVEPPDQPRRVGAEIEEGRAPIHAADQPIRAQRHRFHLGRGGERKIPSAFLATSRGVGAQTAPAARCGAAASFLTSLTMSAWPAACRLDAMKAPMVPTPMNPIFMPVSPRRPAWRSWPRTWRWASPRRRPDG